jgi:hypothetical protein
LGFLVVETVGLGASIGGAPVGHTLQLVGGFGVASPGVCVCSLGLRLRPGGHFLLFCCSIVVVDQEIVVVMIYK